MHSEMFSRDYSLANFLLFAIASSRLHRPLTYLLYKRISRSAEMISQSRELSFVISEAP